MGCGGSKGGPPPPEVVEVEYGKGGSTIMFAPSREERKAAPAAAEAEVSRGGSMIMMNRRINPDAEDDWQPGEPIELPLPPNEDVVYEGAVEAGGPSLQYGYMSEQGCEARPPHKPNQDSLLATSNLGGRPARSLFAVFDGHGPYGEVASHFCRSRLVAQVRTHEAFADNPALALAAAFPDLHDEFCSEETKAAGVNPTFSGTTAVAALIDGDDLHIANVGDSRAIMLRDGPSAVPLSSDHKPAREDERVRVSATSAVLFQESQLRPGGDRDKWYVCRSNKGRTVYGVLFTRSVGDADATEHLGILPDAELQSFKLTPADRHLVLATDGVWDVLSNEEVATIVASSRSAQSAALAVVNTSIERWAPGGGPARRDDITVVVVSLQWSRSSGSIPNPTAATATASAAAPATPAATADASVVDGAGDDAGDAGAGHDGGAATATATPLDGGAAADVADVAVEVEASGEEGAGE